MASEYLKKKYKDVKPDEKVELTPSQKRRNWWDYNLGWVILAAVAVIGGILLVKDIFFRPEPDYQVGYVSRTELPEEVRQSLQDRLAELGEDVNGDGRVLVEVYTYDLGFDEQSMMDVERTTAAITSLTVDLSSGRVYLLLLEDPEGFQRRMGALAYWDGSRPPVEREDYGASDWQQMVCHWEDCPVLAGLDLGTYEEFMAPDAAVNGQEAMSGLYVGRRALYGEDQETAFAADGRLWDKLTQGAQPLA